MIPEFKDGDVFYWSWKDRSKSGHCCAWVAIYRGNTLEDTFWSSDNKRWTPEKAIQELDLEFKGNLNDLEKIDRWESEYYHPLDITDLQHSNSSGAPIYKRKGSTKDRNRMAIIARESAQDYRQHAQHCLNAAVICDEAIKAIFSDGDIDKISIPRRVS